MFLELLVKNISGFQTICKFASLSLKSNGNINGHCVQFADAELHLVNTKWTKVMQSRAKEDFFLILQRYKELQTKVTTLQKTLENQVPLKPIYFCRCHAMKSFSVTSCSLPHTNHSLSRQPPGPDTELVHNQLVHQVHFKHKQYIWLSVQRQKAKGT